VVLLGVVLVRAKAWTMDFPVASFGPLAVALLINLLVCVPMRAQRWRLTLHSPPPFLQVLFAMLEGWLIGTAVGFGAGDPVRSARLRREAGTFARDFGSTLAERGAEFCALAMLTMLAIPFGIVGMWAAAAACTAIAGYFGTLVLGRRLIRRLGRWPRVAEGLTASLAASTPKTILGVMALTLAGWGTEMAILKIFLGTFGLPADLGTTLIIVVGINVAITIPGPPANLGTYEAGMVAALALRGVPTAPALTFAFAYHILISLSVNICGAVVYFVREHHRRK
jgi:uncharacterized membrane protein YbhN (UPF0104 family)